MFEKMAQIWSYVALLVILDVWGATQCSDDSPQSLDMASFIKTILQDSQISSNFNDTLLAAMQKLIERKENGYFDKIREMEDNRNSNTPRKLDFCSNGFCRHSVVFGNQSELQM